MSVEFEKRFNLEPYSFGRALITSDEFSQLERGIIDLEEFAQKAARFYDAIPPNEMRNIMMHIFGSVNFEDSAYDPVKEAIKCLRVDGVKTALLTNNWMISRKFGTHPLPVDRTLFDVVRKL